MKLAVDATWMLRRSFHATNKGFVKVVDEHTGEQKEIQDPRKVATSFIQCVLKKIKDLDYEFETYLLWDYGSWRYRPKEKFKEYKADREYDDTFQCCWDAQDLAMEICQEIGIKNIRVKGLEADDLGMYFAHLPERTVLCTIDGDWRQCLTESACIQDTKDKIIFLEDVIEDQIKTPFDLAISKAINSGGHDNLASVIVEEKYLEGIEGNDKHNRIINAYKQRRLPQTSLDAIDRNMNLSRLDYVLSDEEVKSEIQRQMNIKVGASKLELISSLSKLGNYPAYFLGVIGKYNRLFNQ